MDSLMLADLSGKVVLDGLLQKFESSSSSWYYALETAAQSLFWKLALVSLAWTFISMLFRDEVRDFAAELVRYLLFTGLAWWALINGPAFGQDILNTCIQLGGQAGGFGSGLSPATVADLGLQIFNQVVSPLNWILAPGISLASTIIALGLVCAAVVTACNLLLLVVSGWVAAAAGLVLLGFGGCRWTSDMAANYFRGLLSIGMKVLTMELVIGMGVAFAKGIIAGVTFPLSLTGIMVLCSLFFALAFLSDRLPNAVAGMVGSFIGYPIGNTSWGAGVSAAVTAAGMAASAGTQAAAGAVGAVQAVKEALQAATDAGNANGSANGSMAGMQALAPQPAQPNGAAKAARYAGAAASTVARGAGQVAVDFINRAAASTYPGRLAAAIRQQHAKTQKPRQP